MARKHKTRKQNYKKLKGGNHTLKNSYGVMIIPSGSILYHGSDVKFKETPDKPMLFLTFHPSDWSGGTYITRVKFIQDAYLLFMVNPKRRRYPITLLPLLGNLVKSGRDLNKQYDNNLKCYVKELEKEGLNGWFSSIEGNVNVEVAVINNNALFEILGTDICNRNDEPARNAESNYESNDTINNNRNSNHNNNHNINNNSNSNNNAVPKYIPANWGKNYPISTINFPLTLIINSVYKDIIDSIHKHTRERGIISVVEVIFNNATIHYFDKDIPKLAWDC